MRIVFAIAALTAFAGAAVAQPAAAPAPSAAPPAATSPQPGIPKVDCRANAQSKGLRGQPARDAIAICVEEQRLACLKEAVEKKIVAQQRREFIRTCAGRPAAATKENKADKQDKS
jgi:hypothetical protein